MTTLHVLSSAQSLTRAATAIQNSTAQDDILLRADAVYLLLDKHTALPACLGLLDDATARGINPAFYPHVQWIDYPQWVTRVTKHNCTINW